MYLELHRGVLTSQLRTKQGNRRNEALLREAELWAATAALRTGLPYPYAILEDAWRAVLLLQFHDILPGSAIAWVHREAERRHEEVTAALGSIIERSLEAIAGRPAADPVGGGRAANAAPFARAGAPALGIATLIPDLDPVIVTPGDEGDRLDNGRIRATVDPDGHLEIGRAHV